MPAGRSDRGRVGQTGGRLSAPARVRVVRRGRRGAWSSSHTQLLALQLCETACESPSTPCDARIVRAQPRARTRGSRLRSLRREERSVAVPVFSITRARSRLPTWSCNSTTSSSTTCSPSTSCNSSETTLPPADAMADRTGDRASGWSLTSTRTRYGFTNPVSAGECCGSIDGRRTSGEDTGAPGRRSYAARTAPRRQRVPYSRGMDVGAVMPSAPIEASARESTRAPALSATELAVPLGGDRRRIDRAGRPGVRRARPPGPLPRARARRVAGAHPRSTARRPGRRAGGCGRERARGRRAPPRRRPDRAPPAGGADGGHRRARPSAGSRTGAGKRRARSSRSSSSRSPKRS